MVLRSIWDDCKDMVEYGLATAVFAARTRAVCTIHVGCFDEAPFRARLARERARNSNRLGRLAFSEPSESRENLPVLTAKKIRRSARERENTSASIVRWCWFALTALLSIALASSICSFTTIMLDTVKAQLQALRPKLDKFPVLQQAEVCRSLFARASFLDSFFFLCAVVGTPPLTITQCDCCVSPRQYSDEHAARNHLEFLCCHRESLFFLSLVSPHVCPRRLIVRSSCSHFFSSIHACMHTSISFY